MEEGLLARVRTDAGACGMSLSSWLADAADERLRLQGLRSVVEDWEAAHGVITADELHAFEARVAAANLEQASEAARHLRDLAQRLQSDREPSAAVRVTDLMAALEESVQAAKERRAMPSKPADDPTDPRHRRAAS